MITIEPKSDRQGFVMRSDELCRIEVLVGDDGNLHAFAYSGAEDDLEQEPESVYDGSLYPEAYQEAAPESDSLTAEDICKRVAIDFVERNWEYFFAKGWLDKDNYTAKSVLISEIAQDVQEAAWVISEPMYEKCNQGKDAPFAHFGYHSPYLVVGYLGKFIALDWMPETMEYGIGFCKKEERRLEYFVREK